MLLYTELTLSFTQIAKNQLFLQFHKKSIDPRNYKIYMLTYIFYATEMQMQRPEGRLSAAPDARVIMGGDEAALLRLWREKCGEAEPEDLSGNLIVQLGLVTEALNRHWYERNTGQAVECVQYRLRHPVLRWHKCDLDEFDAVVDYFRLGCPGFRSRRPSPSPPMNSIPTRCKAICIAFKASSETIRLSL